MTELWYRPINWPKTERVDEDFPLPVTIVEEPNLDVGLPPVAHRTARRQLQIPMTTQGTAYAAGDSFGTQFRFPSVLRPRRKSGVIHSAMFYDLSDQGAAVDMHLFRRAPAIVTDNAAYNVTDADILLYLGTISFAAANFIDVGGSRVCTVLNVGLAVVSDDEDLYVQCSTTGTPTVTAGSEPHVAIVVLQD